MENCYENTANYTAN